MSLLCLECEPKPIMYNTRLAIYSWLVSSSFLMDFLFIVVYCIVMLTLSRHSSSIRMSASSIWPYHSYRRRRKWGREGEGGRGREGGGGRGREGEADRQQTDRNQMTHIQMWGVQPIEVDPLMLTDRWGSYHRYSKSQPSLYLLVLSVPRILQNTPQDLSHSPLYYSPSSIFLADRKICTCYLITHGISHLLLKHL